MDIPQQLPPLPPELDHQTLVDLLSTVAFKEKLIRKWIADGSLIRIRRGLYATNTLFQERPWSGGVLATMLCKDACLSMESALELHGLLPVHKARVTAITAGRSKTYDTPLGPFNFVHLPPGLFGWCQHTVTLSDGASYQVAEAEKAVLDLLWSQTAKRSIRKLKQLFFTELGCNAESLCRLEMEKLLGYAKAYRSSTIHAYFIPWLQSLKSAQSS